MLAGMRIRTSRSGVGFATFPGRRPVKFARKMCGVPRTRPKFAATLGGASSSISAFTTIVRRKSSGSCQAFADGSCWAFRGYLPSAMFLHSVDVLIALTLGKYGAIDRSADPKGKLQLTVF